MEAFTLDTSGRVECAASFQPIGWAIWPDLNPFTQGYIEALFAGCVRADTSKPAGQMATPYAFSDLAPETLAAILRDCAEFQSIAAGLGAKTGAVEGRRFWTGRLASFPGVGNPVWTTAFPPLTAYLGDDGKVYLREAAHAS